MFIDNEERNRNTIRSLMSLRKLVFDMSFLVHRQILIFDAAWSVLMAFIINTFKRDIS